VKAVILAAGVGKRLNRGSRLPKCLLNFGGRSLLDRHLSALATAGIDSVSLCVGYEADQIRAAIDLTAEPRILGLHNPLYRLGSIVSLWTARGTLLSGDDVLVMDADVLYDPAILMRLAGSASPTCFLMDRQFDSGDEPVKICLSAGRIVEFRKQIAPGLTYNSIGESVGFFRFSADMARRLATVASAYVADGRTDEPHEEALRDLALAFPEEIGVEDITGLPWIEIDFPEDVDRAKAMLPRIDGR
jgi:choline kinase